MFEQPDLQEEEALSYRAYDQASLNPVALAYYRYERIVRDIAEYCEQLLLTDGLFRKMTSKRFQRASRFPGPAIKNRDPGD